MLQQMKGNEAAFKIHSHNSAWMARACEDLAVKTVGLYKATFACRYEDAHEVSSQVQVNTTGGTIMKKLLVAALVVGAFLGGCVVGAHDVLTTQIISQDENAHEFLSEYRGHLYAQYYEQEMK